MGLENTKTAESVLNQSSKPEKLFEMPQVVESNTSVIIALVLTGLLLALGGVVGIRYLKRRALRNARINQPSTLPIERPQQRSVFVISESVRPSNQQIDLIYTPNLRRVPNTNIQSSQYVQRNNEIILEHTIVIDSFPHYGASLRPGNNHIIQNRPSPTIPLELNPSINSRVSNFQESPPKEDLNPDVRCVICWEQEANVIFVPCAHRCCCTKDGWFIMHNNKTCPMCRNPIEGVINATLKNSSEN